MRARWIQLLSLGVLTLALGSAGCADQDANQDDPATAEGQLKSSEKLSDAAIEGKIGGILSDVSFTSESDYPYVVLEGDVVSATRLTKALVREKLGAAVKEKSGSHRDIRSASCRAVRLNVSGAISEGDKTEVPNDHDSEDYVYAHHDKQLGIALKVMRSQLKSVVGFTFGTNENGDQDDVGPVVYVYVGISKTTGKLIAIMTEAVYT